MWKYRIPHSLFFFTGIRLGGEISIRLGRDIIRAQAYFTNAEKLETTDLPDSTVCGYHYKLKTIYNSSKYST